MQLEKIYKFVLEQSENPNNSKVLLKELLELYNLIYSKLGPVAIKYDNGIHPKHRLIKYHDFFVDNINEGESVLDLGCGKGELTNDIAKKTENEVVGIEVNDNYLQFAREHFKHENLKFIQGDIYKDIPKKHFDVAILSNVLEHLDNRVSLLKEIIKKVTPNKILLRVPYFERDWAVPMKKELGVDYFLDKSHKIEYKQEEFYEEMKEAGLKIEKIKINWGEMWAICKPKKNINLNQELNLNKIELKRDELGIQLTSKQLLEISNSVLKIPNCKFLIFGLGNDTPFWLEINKNGRTAFIEDNKIWFNKLKKKYSIVESYLVEYGTKFEDGETLLYLPSKLKMKLPDKILNIKWDVILVDGPRGWKKGAGRMKSIYMASKLIKKGGHIFVHDSQRKIERIYCKEYLLDRNLIKIVEGELSHYII